MANGHPAICRVQYPAHYRVEDVGFFAVFAKTPIYRVWEYAILPLFEPGHLPILDHNDGAIQAIATHDII